MNLKDFLTQQELIDLEDLRDMTKNSSVDDVEIVCYVKLQELICQEKSIDEFSNEDLLKLLMQMKSSITFLDSTGFVDTEGLCVTYKKIKNLFSDEIKSRNTISSEE